MAKGFFWGDPNKTIKILPKTEEDLKKHFDESETYGFDTIRLSSEHIKALQEGKAIVWDDSEYTTFVVLE